MSNLEKKSFTSEEIKDLVEGWRSSGLSKKQFSDQNGLKYYTFIAWCDKHSKPSERPGFEQMRVTGPEKIFMEVVIAGKTIRFFQPVPRELLTILLH